MRRAYPEPGRGGQDQLLRGDGRHCGGWRTPHGLQRRGRCKTDLQRALRAQCRGQICQIDIVAGDCSAHRARLRSPASRLYASWFGRVRAVRGVLLRWASPRVSHQRRWGVLSQASSCRQYTAASRFWARRDARSKGGVLSPAGGRTKQQLPPSSAWVHWGCMDAGCAGRCVRGSSAALLCVSSLKKLGFDRRDLTSRGRRRRHRGVASAKI